MCIRDRYYTHTHTHTLIGLAEGWLIGLSSLNNLGFHEKCVLCFIWRTLMKQPHRSLSPLLDSMGERREGGEGGELQETWELFIRVALRLSYFSGVPFVRRELFHPSALCHVCRSVWRSPKSFILHNCQTTSVSWVGSKRARVLMEMRSLYSNNFIQDFACEQK